MYNFAELTTNKLPRTKFAMPHNHKSTGNAGDLIPIYCEEVLPSDYRKITVRSLIKMTTPNFQTMDCLFCDVHFYFVPSRLVWEHWQEFMGERSVGPHEVQPEYTIPKTTAPVGGWDEHSIANYLGIPTGVENIKVSSLPFRAYVLIWNEWYRDQNRQDFADFSIGDENNTGSNGDNYVTDPIKGGHCLKAAKIHDFFTSTLLQPQAGEPVTFPFLNDVYAVQGDRNHAFIPYFYDNTGDFIYNSNLYTGGSGNLKACPPNNSNDNNKDTYASFKVSLGDATAVTVNQLRMAFQLQKVLEANARSGTRYVEILKNRWNVVPSDARLQRPEFLGGKRIPINIDMVVQTSGTNETSPLGQISGFSNTYDESEIFSKGFEEHGYIIGLAVVRHQRTYQQGLAKMFTRTTMEDFYMPEFANLGEQPVYNREIFASGTSKDDEVFGYNEYGAEYRFIPNRVSGSFRSNAKNSFDNWHYADDYSECPVNGADWIVENPNSIDRTLTLSHDVVDQFYFDFYFDEVAIRSIPAHSLPGLIDHH